MIKSIFVSTYLLLIHMISAYGFYLIYAQGWELVPLGLMLCSLPGVLFFDRLLLLKPTARTKPHLNSMAIIKMAGLMLILYSTVVTDTVNYFDIALGFTGLIGWLAYDYWYSAYPHRSSTQLRLGQSLPELKLKNPDNTPFDQSLITGSPVVYIFYRGNWCPFCTAQIKEIVLQYKKITSFGTKILLISPQPPGYTEKLAAKFEVPFIFLVDSGAQAARQLGISIKNGLPLGLQIFGYDSDSIMPTVVITDATGKICFADQTDNYRVRPEPEVFLRILQKMQPD